MSFKKGRTKSGGRTKGTKNKVPADIKSKVKNFIDSSFDDVLQAFALLEPRDKVQAWIKLLPYVIAKQKEITSNVDMTLKPYAYDLAKLNDKQLNELSKLVEIMDGPFNFAGPNIPPITSESQMEEP